ncbi:MAG: lysostaphin resistance A-like protein [Salinigranum sp.]
MEGSLRAEVRSVVVALIVAAVGLVAGTGLVVAAVFAVRASGFAVSPLLLIVLSLVSIQGVAFGGVALAYLRYRGYGAGYVGALGGVMIIGTLVTRIGLQAGTNQAAELGRAHPETLLLLVPASFVFIGPGEELLFRGVVQNRLREAFSPVPGVTLASVIFASIHYVALTGTAGARLVAIGILFFPSLIFGTVYELTDNLVVPALVHATYNATLFTLLYVVVKYAGAGAGGAGMIVH